MYMKKPLPVHLTPPGNVKVLRRNHKPHLNKKISESNHGKVTVEK